MKYKRSKSNNTYSTSGRKRKRRCFENENAGRIIGKLSKHSKGFGFVTPFSEEEFEEFLSSRKNDAASSEYPFLSADESGYSLIEKATEYPEIDDAPDADPDANADADANATANADADADAKTGAEAEANAEPDPKAGNLFQEYNLINDRISGDVFIGISKMNGAMNGDTVIAYLSPRSKWRGEKSEGAIGKILVRGCRQTVGTFSRDKKYGFVIPDDKRFSEDIYVRRNDFHGAFPGDKVLVVITKYPDAGQSAEGKITEIIARDGEPGADIKSLIRAYGLRETFPSRANAEAKAVSRIPGGGLDPENRRDLRDRIIITIDGADSKDFDDAVSIEKLSNGNYMLGVHIADVSHYVAENGPLDKEAFKRGNSVYLINQVVPMLPKALSNGICSLNPDVDRYTLSVDMEVSPQGVVVSHDIYESIIHSKARMVYDDVSDIIENNDKLLTEKYKKICPDIYLMQELSLILRDAREKRGSIDFDFDEAHITLDEEGIPLSVDLSLRRSANRMIEEFMLLANTTVAEHFAWMEIPFVYRVHEKPATDKIEELKTFLRSFGIILKGNPENIHPKALNDILMKVHGMPYENVISTVILRAMKKAFYDVECGGHFGLSMKYYCHFTSPIRRYPDLMIHRIIKEVLHGSLSEARIRELGKITAAAAETSSATERQAMELEREVEKMKKAEYLSYHEGEEFDGIVSGVTNFGMYVQLANTIEGMIRVEDLHDDYYDYDAKNYRLLGRLSHRVYTLGDRVRIKVLAASAESRQIDFALVKTYPAEDNSGDIKPADAEN
ncbi:MAG: ribonuclease R [Clostridia bacterium]|nr:ribonuclease R [Clostridia bacterium]